MATGHLAQDLRHDRKVALKVLRPELVAVDSNFTLALRRIPLALGWGEGQNTSPMRLRAGSRNHGLAPRESLLVTVDSLWGALDEGVGASWPLLRRLNGTLREAVARYPEDPEVWYMMGEVGYHFGGHRPR